MGSTVKYTASYGAESVPQSDTSQKKIQVDTAFPCRSVELQMFSSNDKAPANRDERKRLRGCSTCSENLQNRTKFQGYRLAEGAGIKPSREGYSKGQSTNILPRSSCFLRSQRNLDAAVHSCVFGIQSRAHLSSPPVPPQHIDLPPRAIYVDIGGGKNQTALFTRVPVSPL